MSYQPTTATQTVENYPYGRLRTTKTYSLDFDSKKGFRTVEQTINPKTNRLNAPKKSTYSDIIVLDNTNGFVTTRHFSLNGTNEMNKAFAFVNENFDLFTPEQIKYIYGLTVGMCKVSHIAIVQYCGADSDKVKEVLSNTVKTAVKGWNDGLNYFADMTINIEAYEALKVPNYNPFKVTHYEMVLG